MTQARFGRKGSARRSRRIAAAIGAALLGLTGLGAVTGAPPASAQTATATLAINGVDGWVANGWSGARVVNDGSGALTFLPVAWSGVWIQAPSNQQLSHIDVGNGPGFPTFVGAKLADGRFAWTPVSLYTSISTNPPLRVSVPIGALFGEDGSKSYSVQAIAIMANQRVTTERRFGVTASNAPVAAGPAPFTAEVGLSFNVPFGPDANPIFGSAWGCGKLTGSQLSTTCAWGGLGIERRTDDWVYRSTFPKMTWSCLVSPADNTPTATGPTTDVFRKGGAYVVTDNKSIQLAGANLVEITSTRQFRFTVTVPSGTKQLGMVFQNPVNFRFDPDANCKLTPTL
jgi:hypothetical protein